MKYNRLITSIKMEEGYRGLPYLCTEGVWTIGYGFTSIKGVKVTQHTPKMSQELILYCLHEHIFDSINLAMKFVNNFCELSDIRQETLINMCYQLGDRIFLFKKTKKFIENNDFENASIEMLDSLWFKQTPQRAKRMSKQFYSN